MTKETIGAPDYGNNSNSYHYSKKDGGYYYKNLNGSSYHDNGKGVTNYTDPNGKSHKGTNSEKKGGPESVNEWFVFGFYY
ncbi:hypothetical protein D9757_013967 [Collybiopsis confluens]|uniref:Uncharacterized protein n=1 Tax=Collybiopsis confluens TaxID=2823264 RepID=A0A8H5FPX9_9AGAR|nr:hypothetical protein D9757_013967 [Collybiopsis confluens]